MNYSVQLNHRFIGQRRLMSWITILRLMLVLLPIVSSASEETGASRPGQMINIDTHKLHLYCSGEGQPSVIMDTGLGGLSLEWFRTQQLLAQSVKACVYDRAGYGWSEPGPMPRTSSRIADELYLLLTRGRIQGPYVLVGHSFGGYTMQLFASRYPQETAGLVLVDASHPEQVERFLQPPIKLNTAPSGNGKIIRFSQPRLPAGLPAELVPTARKLLLEGKARVALGNEYLNFRESASEVRKAGRLPDVPLVVVTRGTHVWPKTRRGEQMEKLWMDLQTELAGSVQQSAHIVAEKSGHHIHLDQPELVADSIQIVIDATQMVSRSIARNDVSNNFTRQPLPRFQDATWLLNRIGKTGISVVTSTSNSSLISYKLPLDSDTIDQ